MSELLLLLCLDGDMSFVINRDSDCKAFTSFFSRQRASSRHEAIGDGQTRSPFQVVVTNDLLETSGCRLIRQRCVWGYRRIVGGGERADELGRGWSLRVFPRHTAHAPGWTVFLQTEYVCCLRFCLSVWGARIRLAFREPLPFRDK